MLKDRLTKLFEKYDSPIQTVISDVLSVEQEHISMERPRVKDEIDRIISLVANNEVQRTGSNDALER
ncbi:MAG: hypothetical protein M5U01_20385 [Ardenticatenaceae bacterium]|nr:hypothetical protein [Ardenticatenaceae bacterium]